jgi:hypothetical protein
MSRSWYDTSYRKLFFDFHSPGTAVGLASGFDAERWAERVQEANAQAVSVITKGGYGHSFYRKGSIRYVHPHLPSGLDMLEEQIAALHERGIRAIGYYHTFGSEPMVRDHPDWVERDVDGQPRGRSICMLGPLTEEWMLPHIAEIVSLYDVDAMFFDGTYAHSLCYCPACQERFAEASGGLSIPRDATEPHWRRYVEWALQAYRELRQSICDVIHAHRPEAIVSFNWAYTQRQPEVVPESVGALMADILPDDQAFNGSYLSRYWATLGRPFDVMNSAFLQWWGDWGCKPAVAMQQEVSTAIANGGLTWIGYQMTHTFDVAPAVMGEMGKTLAFVKEREPTLVGAEPIPNVAVLLSTSSHMTGARPETRADETIPRGVHRLLTESMIPYHFLHEEALLERLNEFKAVILPDQRYLPLQLVDALAQWVDGGGVLLATARTGTLDQDYEDTGRFALEQVLGLRYEGVYDQPHAYIEVTDERLKSGTLDMPHLTEAVCVLARPIADDVEVLARLRKIYLRGDGQFLLRWSPVSEDSGYPAITLRRVGKGWAVYLAGEVFHAYQVKNQWNLKYVVANLLQMLIEDPLVQVDAPAWLEVVLMKQAAAIAGTGKERTLIHLVNHHGDRPVDGNNVCVEQVLPVRDVTVHLEYATRPTRVTLEPGGRAADWRYVDGVVEVRIPEVYIHTAIAVV